MATEAPNEPETSPSSKPYQLPVFLHPGHKLLRWVGMMMDRLFTHHYNPMHQLGAVAWFCFWTLVVTGLYIYLFYEMAPDRAYDSVQGLTVGQPWLGGIMRSIHRYASAALMLVTLAHIYHVFFSGRVRRYRWLAWITGLIVIPLIWFEGSTGYVMVWDDRGLMAGIEFAKWFDVLPLAMEPFARNFVPGGTLNQLFFFLLSYLHLVIPCALIIILWVHNLRQSKPRVWPYSQLAWAMAVVFVVVAALMPATSGAPADLSHLMGPVKIDWIYLAVFPLANTYAISPIWLWCGTASTFGVLASVPWLMSVDGGVAKFGGKGGNMKKIIPPGGWIVLLAVAGFVGFITSRPAYCFYPENKAKLAVSFKHTTPRIHECPEEELKSYLKGRKDRPRHMRNAKAECGSRERHPLVLRISVDGKVLTEKEIQPSGWRHDTSIFVLEQHVVSVGRHAVIVEAGEQGAAGGYPFKISEEIDFGPRDVVAINFKKPDFKIFK